MNIVPGYTQNSENSPGRPNHIQIENNRKGSADWQLTAPAPNREIEGYASSPSVVHGETLTFFVNTIAEEFTIEIFRLGWYQGLGGRLLAQSAALPGRQQTNTVSDPDTGLIECCWEADWHLTIPADARDEWTTGCYVAKLSTIAGDAQAYIPFVVRDDQIQSGILFQSSFLTFQAYNRWGGRCLYDYLSEGGRKADKVSFNRPFAATHNPRNAIGVGASDLIIGSEGGAPGGWETCAIRFLEREGYAVAYCTDLDTHVNPEMITRHHAFLSVGHDEYWTLEKRRAVETAQANGVALLFLGANACYWQVRLEPSHAQPANSNRTLVCYKYHPTDYIGDYTRDPFAAGKSPEEHAQITVRFRDALKGTSRKASAEQLLTGAMYRFEGDEACDDLVVKNSTHWIFDGTELKQGWRLPGLVGYEYDIVHGEAQADLTILCESPCSGGRITRMVRSNRLLRKMIKERQIRLLERRLWGALYLVMKAMQVRLTGDRQAAIAHMTIREPENGGFVFCAGTINWCWGLDNWGAEQQLRPRYESKAAQQMMRNLLARATPEPK
jgi:hypothetical protein